MPNAEKIPRHCNTAIGHIQHNINLMEIYNINLMESRGIKLWHIHVRSSTHTVEKIPQHCIAAYSSLYQFGGKSRNQSVDENAPCKYSSKKVETGNFEAR